MEGANAQVPVPVDADAWRLAGQGWQWHSSSCSSCSHSSRDLCLAWDECRHPSADGQEGQQGSTQQLRSAARHLCTEVSWVSVQCPEKNFWTQNPYRIIPLTTVIKMSLTPTGPLNFATTETTATPVEGRFHVARTFFVSTQFYNLPVGVRKEDMWPKGCSSAQEIYTIFFAQSWKWAWPNCATNILHFHENSRTVDACYKQS